MNLQQVWLIGVVFFQKFWLSSFSQSCSKESLINDADDPEDFLEIKNVKIIHRNGNDVITKIEKID